MLILDLTNHKADITFFTFHSAVTKSDIDQRFPSTILSLEFLLRLPQSFTSNGSKPGLDFPSGIQNLPVVCPPTLDLYLNLFLENAIYDVLTEMKAIQLRQFIIDARSSIISPSIGAITPKNNRSLSFNSPFF